MENEDYTKNEDKMQFFLNSKTEISLYSRNEYKKYSYSKVEYESKDVYIGNDILVLNMEQVLSSRTQHTYDINFININNLPLIKILIFTYIPLIFKCIYVTIFDDAEYNNNLCLFKNLPPTLNRIYFPRHNKCVDSMFRLPFGCEIVYYDDYNDIIELNKTKLYSIHFIEEYNLY